MRCNYIVKIDNKAQELKCIYSATDTTECIGVNSVEDAQSCSALDIIITLRDTKEALKHGEASHTWEPENSIC